MKLFLFFVLLVLSLHCVQASQRVERDIFVKSKHGDKQCGAICKDGSECIEKCPFCVEWPSGQKKCTAEDLVPK
jgi:hypothetical protein